MKVIDFRLRPPFGTFLNSFLFDMASIEVGSAKMGFTPSEAARQKSMDLLIQEMDEANVVKGVVQIRKTTKGDNEDIARLQALYPDRFAGFAWIDPLQRGLALQDIDTFVTDGPCVGITLEPAIDTTPVKWKVDDEQIAYPIYEKCEKGNIPISLTWGGIMSDFNDYNPAPLRNVCRDFPNLKLVLGHGCFPWVTAVVQVAMQCPNLYISPDVYMSSHCVGSADYFLAANYTLQDQIIFGAGFPGTTFKDSVDDYLSHLRPEVAEKILYKNAAKVLNLE